jgi:translation elongation factor EF-G
MHAQGPLHGATLDGVSIPAPVFALAVEPVSSSKQQAMEEALAVMQREDPSLRVDADAESGQLLLRGVGELHLDIICDKLRRLHNVEVETGRAYVAYREGIAAGGQPAPTVQTTVYDRQVGGRRLFAGLRIRLEPVGTVAAHAAPELALEDAAERVRRWAGACALCCPSGSGWTLTACPLVRLSVSPPNRWAHRC